MKLKHHSKALLAMAQRQARAAVVLALVLGAGGANAGWIDAVRNITTLMQGGAVALTAICGVAGIAAFAYAGKLLWKKGGDRGDDVEMSKVGWAMVAGVFLVAIAWVALQSVETLGGSAGDIGRTITLPNN